MNYKRTRQCWRGIRYRTTNPNYHQFKDYGGRGIKMCERWAIFENFLADMGEIPDGMTIERINNDGNYEPSNCRWATHKEQARNKRNNKIFVVDGVKACVEDLCKMYGKHPNTVLQRLQKGYAIKDALTIPKQQPRPPLKLSELDVNTIRILRHQGEKLSVLASKYGVAFQTISAICHFNKRANVTVGEVSTNNVVHIKEALRRAIG